MGKLITPDPDLWENPDHRAALEEKAERRRVEAKRNYRRMILTITVVVVFLLPFILALLKL
ncbi:MAG: hypothetical protein CSA35_06640 [Dethiosulfovibrio peptidovorans]|nr:MAG: hypothetical protein CSA35_06640 [Dethiosulfovibrio peptidovorans]